MFHIDSAFSQLSSNPNHELYRYIDYWEGRGYVRQLPPLRPYPEIVLKEILTTVGKKGDAESRMVAERYLKNLTERVHWEVHVEHESNSDMEAYHWKIGFGAAISGFMTPLVSYSADSTLFLLGTDPLDPFAPTGQRSSFDVVFDHTDTGNNTTVLWQLRTSASVGIENAYLHTAMSRHSMAPFFGDTITLSSDAPQAPGFDIFWGGKIVSYSSIFLALEAQDRNGNQKSPEKFLHLHMLSFYPTDWLEIGVYESVIWGARFDPKYFIPIKILLHLESLGGYPDNVLMGLYMDFRVAQSVKIATSIYVDDMGFEDILTFDFDTKYKLAAQFGVSWSPSLSWLRRLSADYSLATPYMYTHVSKGNAETNYLNYTHQGSFLGAHLPPNSDRLRVEANFKIWDFTDFVFSFVFSQHGNASEGIIDHLANDGSVHDSGYEGNNPGANPVFQDTTHFLQQDIIERYVQMNFTLRSRIPTAKHFEIIPELSYSFEYTWNKDLERGENSANHYLDLTLVFKFLPPQRPKESI